MKKLNELALQYKTDKSSDANNYAEKYETYFAPFRNKEVKVLEIGVGSGASLKMWKEYFTKGQIYGLDIMDCSALQEDRIKIIQGSQSDIPFLESMNAEYGPFDIIIDDGSHINEEMITSFSTLFPMLNPGGMYAVESLLSCYWPWAQPNVNNNFNVAIQQLVHNVNACGKTGTTKIENDETDVIYSGKRMGEMTYWDMNVKSLHLHRGIVFVEKYELIKK